jgi:FkbM family methyltransferase
MRRAFVDIGANVGKVSFEFARDNPAHEIYCVEANGDLIKHIYEKAFDSRRTFIVIWAAAWTYDGTMNLFESASNAAATVVPGKVERGTWPQIDYEAPVTVPCFDFSQWLLRTFSLKDDLTIKMDIEGAEYDVVEKMIKDRSILLARKLICEWHHDRFPTVSLERHNAIRARVAAMTDLVDWT